MVADSEWDFRATWSKGKKKATSGDQNAAARILIKYISSHCSALKGKGIFTHVFVSVSKISQSHWIDFNETLKVHHWMHIFYSYNFYIQ